MPLMKPRRDTAGKKSTFKPDERVWVIPMKCWATVVDQLLHWDCEESFWGNVRVRYDDGVEGTCNSWQLRRTRHPEELYLKTDPFFPEETEKTCCTVKLVKARKQHVCYGLDGAQDHDITVGELYRHEKALIDRDFWGEYKMCLRCMDKLFDCGEDVDEDDQTQK